MSFWQKKSPFGKLFHVLLANNMCPFGKFYVFWQILCPFGKFYVLLANFMSFWQIGCPFGKKTCPFGKLMKLY